MQQYTQALCAKPSNAPSWSQWHVAFSPVPRPATAPLTRAGTSPHTPPLLLSSSECSGRLFQVAGILPLRLLEPTALAFCE